MKSATEAWKQYLFLIVIFAAIATILLASLASDTVIPSLSDMENHIASIIQAKLALAEGQFPLRIAPLEQNGLRYPLYQFYSPTSYFIAGIMYRFVTPSSAFLAYKAVLWCALIISGVFMYRLAYWFVKSVPAAVMASVVYLTNPYCIMMINHIGAFNETIAVNLLPAVLYYTLQRFVRPYEYKTLIQVGLVWYLLATIHLITFVYSSFFVACLLFILTLRHRQYAKNLIFTGIAYAFGCLLAAWYLFPILLLAKNLIQITGFRMLQYYHMPLFDLISFRAHIPKELTNTLELHPAIGWPILVAVGITMYALILQKIRGSVMTIDANKTLDSSEDQIKQQLLWPLLILFFISFIFIWSPIDVWRWVPSYLHIAQYSWRLLAQTSWIGALLFAWSVCWLFQSKLGDLHLIMGISYVMLATRTWYPTPELPHTKLSVVTDHPLISFNSNAYLLDPHTYPHVDKTQGSLNPTTTLSVDQVKPFCLQYNEDTFCRIPVPLGITLLELPIIYYPNMLDIRLNGQSVSYTNVFAPMGLITAIVPRSGEINVIKMRFSGLQWANKVSELFWGLWLGGCVWMLRKRVLTMTSFFCSVQR